MKDQLSGIKVLVFDAYGTLLDVGSMAVLLEEHFKEKAESINASWRAKQLQYTWLRSLMQKYKPFSMVTAEALEFACIENNTTLNPKTLDSLMSHYYILKCFPEVSDLLRVLSVKLPCAILSNADLPMLQKACDHNNLLPHLNAILSADTVKINKPDPQVYQLVLDHYKCSASEVGFVSSNTWDITGAKSFGFKAIWLNRGRQPMETMGFPEDLKINSLTELLD